LVANSARLQAVWHAYFSLRNTISLQLLPLLLRLSNIPWGDSELHRPRHTALRLVAILMAALVVSFALQATVHWHSNSFEDHHCRVCHVAHSVTVDLSVGTAPVAPNLIVRLISAPSIDPALDLVFHQLSSRAPPA